MERRERRERQRRLKERFLDLATAYVAARMRYLRRIGVQPPDPETKPRKKPR